MNHIRRFAMPGEAQAEIFIETLEDMRDEERARQMDRLRPKLKAQAERFAKALWA